jgi:hypothetical protein
MAVEIFGTNYAVTTVASGGYSSGASALNVVSTSTGTGLAAFPTSGNFRVTIFNQGTGAPEAVLKVTAIASGTQFTTTAELDGNASAGDIVICTITPGGVEALLAQMNQTGTYSSLPSTVPFAGCRYKCTDAPYEFISNGSLWVAYYNGFPATPPPSGGWTSINITTPAFVAYTNGYGFLAGQTSASSNFLTGQRIAAPGSTPYSFVARINQDCSGIITSLVQTGGGTPGTANDAGFAVGFSDGTKYVVMMVWLQGTSTPAPVIEITEWSSSTSVNTSVLTLNNWNMAQFYTSDLWLKIRNDGTDLYFFISIDGNNWYYIYKSTITNYLSAATDVFWGAYGNTDSAAIALYDWTQGT